MVYGYIVETTSDVESHLSLWDEVNRRGRVATNDPREPNGVVAEIRADVDGKVRRMFFRNGLGGDHPAVAPEVGQRYFWGEWVNGLGTVSRWGTVVARYPYRREVDES